MKFKPGSIVILRSNGPNMVMEAPASDGRIVCIWFDGNRLKREVFQPETLRTLLKRRGFSTIALGVWIWGGFTTILAIACLVVVFLQGFSVGFVKEMFESLKETGALVAGILGFSGLASATGGGSVISCVARRRDEVARYTLRTSPSLRSG
jgi:uncharacterized protein YodC (DUF2158 family)